MTAIDVQISPHQIAQLLNSDRTLNVGDEVNCRLIVTKIVRTAVETTAYNTGTQFAEGVQRVTLTVADPVRGQLA